MTANSKQRRKAKRAEQMGRAVETRLAHIPVRGPKVPTGGETIATNQVDEHDPSKGTTPTRRPA